MKGNFIENNLIKNQKSNLIDNHRLIVENKNESSFEISDIILIELKSMISSFNEIISEFYQIEEKSKIDKVYLIRPMLQAKY